MKILLLDDSLTQRALYEEVLRRNHEVVACSDAEDFLVLAYPDLERRNPAYSAAFIDVMMPSYSAGIRAYLNNHGEWLERTLALPWIEKGGEGQEGAIITKFLTDRQKELKTQAEALTKENGVDHSSESLQRRIAALGQVVPSHLCPMPIFLMSSETRHMFYAIHTGAKKFLHKNLGNGEAHEEILDRLERTVSSETYHIIASRSGELQKAEEKVQGLIENKQAMLTHNGTAGNKNPTY